MVLIFNDPCSCWRWSCSVRVSGRAEIAECARCVSGGPRREVAVRGYLCPALEASRGRQQPCSQEHALYGHRCLKYREPLTMSPDHRQAHTRPCPFQCVFETPPRRACCQRAKGKVFGGKGGMRWGPCFHREPRPQVLMPPCEYASSPCLCSREIRSPLHA